MEKIKILLTSNDYRFQKNGVSIVVEKLLKELRSRGYDVRVLALSDSNRSWKGNGEYFIASCSAPYYYDARMSFRFSDKLLDELKEWKPDIVHCHTEGSTFKMAKAIAAEIGVPFVFTIHTDIVQFVFGKHRNDKVIKGIAGLLGRWYYRCVDKIIAPSEKSADYPRISAHKDKVVIIPNGIELEELQKPVSDNELRALRVKYSLGGSKVLLVVSRLSKEKSIIELIKSLPLILRKCPDTKLLIVGDGPDRKSLERSARNAGLSDKVIFTGYIPHDKLYRYYALGDVFISASTFENMSMTYIEAMACGLPLLCKDDPCLKGVLTHGFNGLSFRNEREFVKEAVRLLTNDSLRKTMGSNSLEAVSKFGIAKHTDRTLELYERLIRSKVKTKNNDIIRICMCSAAAMVKGQGVGTAAGDLTDLLRKKGGKNIRVYENRCFFGCDVVHFQTNGLLNLIKMKLSPKPTIASVHFTPESWNGALRLPAPILHIWLRYMMYFYRCADILHTVNPDAKKYLIRHGFDQRRIFFIPNAIDPDFFQKSSDDSKRDAVRKKHGFQADDIIVLGSGQLQTKKGVEDFAKTARLLPDIKFVWVGGFSFSMLSSGYPKIKALVSDPPDNLTFTGIIERSELRDLLDAVDIFFLPSYHEQFSMAIIEAANMKLPLLLRDISVYKNIYPADDYLRSDSPKAFAEKIKKLAYDKEFRTKYINGAERIAKRYDNEKILTSWKRLYKYAKNTLH